MVQELNQCHYFVFGKRNGNIIGARQFDFVEGDFAAARDRATAHRDYLIKIGCQEVSGTLTKTQPLWWLDHPSEGENT